jgi:hypothetical protein
VTLWTAKSELRYRAEGIREDFGYTKLRGFVMKSLAGIKLSKAHQVQRAVRDVASNVCTDAACCVAFSRG